jgi:hypothetical protein
MTKTKRVKKPKSTEKYIPSVVTEMIPVDSTRIKQIGYEKDSKTCRIDFHKGGCYEYSPFPSELWFTFKAAKSHGKFFEQHIKPLTESQKVKTIKLTRG